MRVGVLFACAARVVQEELVGDERSGPHRIDAWGRRHAARGRLQRELWARPRDLVEIDPEIEILEPTWAVDEIDGWALDPDARDFLLRLHDQAFVEPAGLTPEERLAVVVGELRDAFASGWLVLHAMRIRGGGQGDEPDQPKPPSSRPPGDRPRTAWIEIAIFVGDEPLAHEPVAIAEEGSTPRTFKTNDEGFVRVEGLEPGMCDVSFPRADGREWARRGAKFPHGSDEVAKTHRVGDAECMTHIAFDAGFRAGATLYTHPCNRELRTLRPNPSLLWPGDQVKILARELRTDPAQTGKRHEYHMVPAERWLRVILHDELRRPLRECPYVFTVEGRRPSHRSTNGDGLLEEPVPAWAVRARIETARFDWTVEIAALLPVAKSPDHGQRGARQRLFNLGHPAAPQPPEEVTTRSAVAAPSDPEPFGNPNFDPEVWRFQRLSALNDTGDVDAPTIDASVSAHLV